MLYSNVQLCSLVINVAAGVLLRIFWHLLPQTVTVRKDEVGRKDDKEEHNERGEAEDNAINGRDL
jgi:hypothetical protein